MKTYERPKVEDLIAGGRAAWFEAGFSWDRLSRQASGPDQEIHTFWSSDPDTGATRSDEELSAAGELIKVDNQETYHIAHLPLTYADGTPTLKQTEPLKTAAHLDAIIQKRLTTPALYASSKTLRFDGMVVPANIRLDKEISRDIVFSRAIFEGEFDAQSVMFRGTANFEHVMFLGKVRIGGAHFEQKANFTFALFAEDAFIGTRSSARDLAVERTEFRRQASFRDSTFAEIAYFERVQWRNSVSFRNTSFRGPARFWSAVFDSRVYFERCEFVDAMLFGLATFGDLAYFHRIVWPAAPIFYMRAFERTKFKDIADFSDSGLAHFSAFSGALFEKGIVYDKVADSHVTKDYKQEKNWIKARNIKAQAHTDLVRIYYKSLLGENAQLTGKAVNDLRDALLSHLEAGCRTLKREMEKVSDKTREQLMYRCELTARRAQSETPRVEKVLSFLYERFSDYGSNQLKPFEGLIYLWLAFALAYFPMSTKPIGDISQSPAITSPHHTDSLAVISGQLIGPRTAEVLVVSASRVFPFGAFDDVSKTFAQNTDRTNAWLGFLFRVLATIESFLSLTLAFMFGLAVRRRFQID